MRDNFDVRAARRDSVAPKIASANTKSIWSRSPVRQSPPKLAVNVKGVGRLWSYVQNHCWTIWCLGTEVTEVTEVGTEVTEVTKHQTVQQ